MYMLQSLLQPRDTQRTAVRHERRRRRPSQLPLQTGRPGEVDPTPSPDRYRLRNELYVCAKVAGLHAIVGAFLLGIVVLVVGLVQLSPGAEAAQHRYYLMGCGGALLAGGLVGALLRCLCLKLINRSFRAEDVEAPTPAQATTKNGVSVVDGHGHGRGHAHDHHKPEKPRLKTQASVGRDVDTLIKQPSAASDT